jgi:hypothetical protein
MIINETYSPSRESGKDRSPVSWLHEQCTHFEDGIPPPKKKFIRKRRTKRNGIRASGAKGILRGEERRSEKPVCKSVYSSSDALKCSLHYYGGNAFSGRGVEEQFPCVWSE